MFELLADSRVASPAARFVSRFTQAKPQALQRIREEFPNRDLYVQPDRGTEGTGCVYLAKDVLLDEEQPEFLTDQDLVVRERVGNLAYGGRDFVVRINVTYDGKTFAAESGYCLVGDKVVSAAAGAVKENIHRVLGGLGLEEGETDAIRAAACAAIKAVSQGSTPPRLAGVDLVLEKKADLVPHVIDINPRPVVVGSRIIGSDALGLGEHFWRGICTTNGKGRLVLSQSSDRSFGSCSGCLFRPAVS
jgi:hypothetical protein